MFKGLLVNAVTGIVFFISIFVVGPILPGNSAIVLFGTCGIIAAIIRFLLSKKLGYVSEAKQEREFSKKYDNVHNRTNNQFKANKDEFKFIATTLGKLSKLGYEIEYDLSNMGRPKDNKKENVIESKGYDENFLQEARKYGRNFDVALGNLNSKFKTHLSKTLNQGYASFYEITINDVNSHKREIEQIKKNFDSICGYQEKSKESVRKINKDFSKYTSELERFKNTLKMKKDNIRTTINNEMFS